jgi:hypothetical protein
MIDLICSGLLGGVLGWHVHKAYYAPRVLDLDAIAEQIRAEYRASFAREFQDVGTTAPSNDSKGH